MPKGTQAQTQGTETEASIVFETDVDMNILPTNLKAVLQITRDPSGNKYSNITTTIAAPPANGATILAPGAPKLQPGQPAQPAPPVELVFGFDQQTTLAMQLSFSFSSPIIVDPATNNPQAAVTWFYSTADTNDPSAWHSIPSSNIIDNTNGLQQEGSVIFTPPASWASQTPTSANQQPPQWTTTPMTTADTVTDSLFWIGFTIVNQIAATAVAAAPPLQVGLKYMLFNAVSAYNALTILIPENLGQSDGTSYQVLQLRNRPLFKRPGTDTPYDHLVIQVGGVTWTQVDEFPAGAGNYYRVNPVTGEISFGNFDPNSNKQGLHGSIPPKGTQITAETYRYVAGGLAGNVGAGRVNALVKPNSAIANVINTISSFDAADEEPIEETLRRAPEQLKSHDRAVTAEDYEFLAHEATSDVVIARCLEPRVHGTATADPPPTPGAWNPLDPWLFAGINRAPGNVNVVIVPDQGMSIARPYPTHDLLHEVQAYLDKRRDVSAKLLVAGPYYLPIAVTITVTVWNRAIAQGLISSTNDVTTDMQNKLQLYLHPVHGGLDGQGWQVGQSVFIADLFKAIMPDESVGFISSLTLAAEAPAYTPSTRPTLPSSPGAWVSVADYELVCYGTTSKITASTL